MGAGPDKLFLEVAGLPVVSHAWLGFDHHPEIDEIIVVIREDARPQFQELAKKLPLKNPYQFVNGGAQRQDSVMNGLSAIRENGELVASTTGRGRLSAH